MSELISIVVPVYNSEKTIKRCIDSLINQTYKNIEIIVINDGSTDSSMDILSSIQDSRIKVFHQENQGLSSARNKGIMLSEGEYIGFVDSDDYVNLDMFEVLLEQARLNHVDIVECSIQYVSNKGIPLYLVNHGESKMMSVKQALEEHVYCSDRVSSSVCNKLFRKALFEGILFPVGRIYEDSSTIYKLIMNSNGYYYIDYIGYFYVKTENESIMNQSFSLKRFDRVTCSLERFLNISEVYPMFSNELNTQLFSFCCWFIFQTIENGLLKEFMNKINESRKIIKDYVHFHELTLQDKLIYLAILYFFSGVVCIKKVKMLLNN